jgi:hypothetical protein
MNGEKLMKLRNAILMGTALLFANTVFAQETQKVEVAVDYSYLRFNPEISQLHSRSFNGGGGSISYSFMKNFAIKAEFMGYGSTDFTTTFTSPTITPRGTILPGTYSSQGNMFTYLFGPVIKFPVSKVTPFGEILWGGSNSNGYVNLSRSIVSIGAAPTQHPFTMAVGGGLDFNVSTHLAIRPLEIDYLLTRYNNPISNINNQNNFRYIAGAIFKF